MKTHFLSILSFLAILIMFTGCEKTKEPIKEFGPEYSEQVKEIIDTKNAKIQAWYAKGMIDSAAAHFADNCIQMPPNQPPTKGKDNFIASWNQSIQFGTWQFDLKTQEVKASGDLATELGSYSLTFTPNENSPIPAMTDKGNYVVLWERIDGDWKIVWDAPVSTVPLAIPELPAEE